MHSASLKLLILLTFAIALAVYFILQFRSDNTVIIYTAKSIITMEQAPARVEAVAVKNGKIVGLGSATELQQQFSEQSLEIDHRFKDKTLMPGFIENHLHPAMAAVLLPLNWITPFDWNLPSKSVKGIQGQAQYLAALSSAIDQFYQHHDSDELFISWGFHHYFHGEISRQALDKIAKDKPVMIWHRSFHEIYFNSAALSRVSFSDEELKNQAHVDLEKGHFYETGLALAMAKFKSDVLKPGRFMDGLEQVKEVTHSGGITTIADMAAGMFSLNLEWHSMKWVLDDNQVPFRTLLIPMFDKLNSEPASNDAMAHHQELLEKGSDKFRYVKQVKLFSDGAFYSLLMQMREPGYLDGHHGAWLIEPERLKKLMNSYWQAGYQMHIHTNGDLGAKAVLDIVAQLQQENPRQDHRTTLHHLGYIGPDQASQIAELGMLVSANPYYLYTLGEKYSEIGLGPERAENIFRARDLLDHKIPLSLHSDFTMAPAQPLLLAWVAVNRVGANGKVLAPEQKLSVHEAMRAITIDAAHAIQMENQVGSIKVGKKADFTVLEQDPYEVDAMALRDIPIWGTVFEGRPFPLKP